MTPGWDLFDQLVTDTCWTLSSIRADRSNLERLGTIFRSQFLSQTTIRRQGHFKGGFIPCGGIVKEIQILLMSHPDSHTIQRNNRLVC